MKTFQGKTLSWNWTDGVIELTLDSAPCNEIGSATLPELERFVEALAKLQNESHALIISSARKEGFCAGADLRELYRESQPLAPNERGARLRDFLERIHRVMNAIDSVPLTTIAAIQGIAFGGGFELALVCDLIIADKTARFCFPELRLGLIPGFGGIPRLQARPGQRGGPRFAAYGPQYQRYQGAGGGAGQPSSRRRRCSADCAFHGGAIEEV